MAFFVSLGYGLVSSVVPLFNSEAYLAAAQVSQVSDSLPTGLGVGVGQAIGKLGLFLAVRHGLTWGFVQRLTARATSRSSGPPWRWLAGVQRASATLLGLLNRDRYAAPILSLSALTGFPPTLVLTVVLAPGRMRTGIFCVIVSIGMTMRYALMALVFGGIVTLF